MSDGPSAPFELAWRNDDVEINVATENLHFFDVKTHEAIWS